MAEKLKILPLEDWIMDEETYPLIIAGPCSAESKEQISRTAKELDKISKVKLFRAGVWKPRTRPGTFEGAGIQALEWLIEIENETKLSAVVEVANKEHVVACINHGIKNIWIGARTTASPFAIQEIANAIKGIDIAVFVKNPINPDLDLWIGALERFNEAGINKLAAIHRGFFPFEKTDLRNIPKWEIPIELKSRYHNLPIICDPSHIAGTREYIHEISQKAMDINMDGLMIESHFNPSVALSDVKQQIKPGDLASLLDKLIIRRSSNGDHNFSDYLDKYREQIDSIDSQMIDLLSKRMRVVKDIGTYKHEKNIAVFQLKRWEEILKTRIHLGEKLGVQKTFLKKVLHLLHKESIMIQTEIMSVLNKSKVEKED